MKKLDLGQTLHVLGNLGVIVGILLLVYELNQNRDMMMAQTRNELSQGIVEILLDISNSEERASIFYRGAAGEGLSEEENTQYRYMAFAELRYNENVYYQYRNGLYDEGEFQAQRAQWTDFLYNQKGRVGVFCSARSGYSPEFVAEIEGLLTTYKCD